MRKINVYVCEVQEGIDIYKIAIAEARLTEEDFTESGYLTLKAQAELKLPGETECIGIETLKVENNTQDGLIAEDTFGIKWRSKDAIVWHEIKE